MKIISPTVSFILKKPILQIMTKVFLFLCFTSVFSFTPNKANSQIAKISIDSNKTLSIESVFELIQNQAGYTFVYSDEMIANAPDVYLKKGIIRADKLLKKGLTPIGCTYEFTENETVVVRKMTTTIEVQQTLSGNISDENGQPLPGATVIVKGTTQGTTSDFDGNFSISANIGDTLTFTFVGFKTQSILVENTNDITVILTEEANQLDDVIVTALGIERAERSVGYATQGVDGSELEESNETNLINALNGKISGVQITNSSGAIGSSSSIILRGAKSVTGKNQPLFIIDGIPISNEVHQSTRNFTGRGNPNASGYDGEGSISNGEQQVDFGNSAGEINPADIESVQVLKGANAAALYGSRAANGVILITTKTGNRKRGIGVSVNSTVSFQSALKTPIFQTEFGKGNNGFYSYPDINANVGKNFGPRFNGQMIPQYDVNNPSVPIIRPWINRLGSDPIGDFLNTGTTLINGFSVTNGMENGDFRLSYTKFDQQGIVPNTDLSRNSVSLSGSYKPTSKLTVKASINYIQSESDNRPNIGAKSRSNVIRNILKLGGNESLEELKNYWKPFRENVEQSTADTSINNPYFSVYENTNGNDRQRVFGNMSLNYKFNENLSLQFRTGKDFYSDKRTTKKAFSHSSYKNGFYSQASVFYSEDNTDLLLTYNEDINDDFTINLIGGVNRLNIKTEELRGRSGYGSGLVTPGFFNLSNSEESPVAQNFTTNKRINSVYGSATFGYRNYLFLDVTARNDWSSSLPAANNSYFYPSASISAIISDIVDLSSLKIDYLKLRGSYAEVGNDTDPYQTNPYTFSGGSVEGIAINSILPTVGNKNLVPENIVSTEFGIEGGLFNNRVGFDITFYKSNNNQQIATVPLATETGFLNRVINVPAKISNQGVELSLNVVPIKTNDFIWDLTLNWSKNENTVSGFSNLADGQRFTLAERWINIDIVNGGSFGNFYGDYLLRVDENGKLGQKGLQIFRPDGRSEESDDVGSLIAEKKPLIGNGFPDWVGGVLNSFTYKNFNLSVLFDTNQGGELYSRTNNEGKKLGALIESVTLQERDNAAAAAAAAAAGKNVQPGEHWSVLEGALINKSTGETTPSTIYARTENFYKRYFDNDDTGTYDRSFVKLRELKLSYSFKEELSKWHISSATLAVFGRNLALWDNIPHVDPEAAGYSGEIPGGEFYNIPSSKSYGISLNINF